MSSSFRPLKTAPATVAALADDARRHAPVALSLAGAAASGWRDDGPQTWCDAAFGGGWTFLAIWRAWQEAAPRPARLHVVGVVHRPHTQAALRDLLLPDEGIHEQATPAGSDQAWRTCAEALIAQWPAALPGQHRLVFEAGRVTLTLLFGEPAQTLPRAGFLADGFLGVGAAGDDLHARVAALARHAAGGAQWWAPKDDALPDAWRRVAFAAQPAGPAHGHASPGLMRATRKDGVPLRGEAAHRATWHGERRATVVGAGIAGAHVAHALARRGWHVTVLAAGQPNTGHVSAAMTPVIARDDDARARLTRAGAGCAARVWRALAQDFAAQGTCAAWVCGTVQVDKPGGRASDLADTLAHLGFPPDWVRAVDRDEASRLAGLPLDRGGLYFSQGMRVRPDLLVAQLLAHANIQLLDGHAARLDSAGGLWRVLGADGTVLAQAGQLVLATAAGTPDLLAASAVPASLPVLATMHRLAGEVTLLPSGRLLGGPTCVVAGEGYVLPALADAVVAGSTYVRAAMHTRVTAAGQQTTTGKLSGLIDMPAAAALHQMAIEAADASPAQPRWPGWAGWRAVVAGRLPQIGPVPQAHGLWLATAFGSRGLTWGALAGEMIAGTLEGEPDILDADLVRLVAPR